MNRIKRISLMLLMALSLSACVNTQSINQEAATTYVGVVQQAQAKGLLDTSSATSKRIHNVFYRMKPFAEKANKTGVPFNWAISVVRSNELNAWAMPGGKIMFYTGLVDQLNLSDDEIATVMGHEMAHALKEHGKSGANLNAISTIAANIGKIALQSQGVSTNFGNFDVIDILKDYGLNKPFSRSHETEADEVGLFLMAESGFNPQAAPNVWKKMSQATGGAGSFLESIVSTHPVNADRQQNLNRLLPKAMEIYTMSRYKR